VGGVTGDNGSGASPFDDGPDNDIPGAPIPAHERMWRHPSEVGYASFKALPPPDIGRTGRGLLAFAFVAGCLLLTGLLVVVRPNDGRSNSEDIVRLASSNMSIATISSDGGAITDSSPLAVHLSGTPYLVTTRRAIDAGSDYAVDLHLANGTSATAQVIVYDRSLVILSLEPDNSLTDISIPGSLSVSSGQMVTVALTSSGFSFVVDESTSASSTELLLRSMEDDTDVRAVVEGAPVVDKTGRLVGLVTMASGGTTLVPITAIDELMQNLVSDGGNGATRSDQPPRSTTAP